MKREICRVMTDLVGERLTTAYGGNVSARVPEARRIWITPSGLYKGSVTPSHLVMVDLDSGVTEGRMKPSRETGMHNLLYKARVDVNAVIHCHPGFATALGMAGRTISPVSVEAAMLGKVPLVPYSTPGGERLAHAVSRAIGQKSNTLILQNHGILAVGGSLESALRRVQTLEDAARMMFIAEQFGGTTRIGGRGVRRLLTMGGV